MFYLETGLLCKKLGIEYDLDSYMKQYYDVVDSCDGYYLGKSDDTSLILGASLS